MLSIHQYNTRKATIQRHAQAALEGLRKRADTEKLSVEVIVERAAEIGRRQAEDMARLDREMATMELPSFNINENVRLTLTPAGAMVWLGYQHQLGVKDPPAEQVIVTTLYEAFAVFGPVMRGLPPFEGGMVEFPGAALSRELPQ